MIFGVKRVSKLLSKNETFFCAYKLNMERIHDFYFILYYYSGLVNCIHGNFAENSIIK